MKRKNSRCESKQPERDVGGGKNRVCCNQAWEVPEMIYRRQCYTGKQAQLEKASRRRKVGGSRWYLDIFLVETTIAGSGRAVATGPSGPLRPFRSLRAASIRAKLDFFTHPCGDVDARIHHPWWKQV